MQSLALLAVVSNHSKSFLLEHYCRNACVQKQKYTARHADSMTKSPKEFTVYMQTYMQLSNCAFWWKTAAAFNITFYKTTL